MAFKPHFPDAELLPTPVKWVNIEDTWPISHPEVAGKLAHYELEQR